MLRILPLTILLATAALATGCSSTHTLTHSGADPEWSGTAKTRVLIVGLADRGYRIPFEDTFVAELQSRGIDAVASYRHAPDTSFFDSVEEVDQVLAATSVDSVLTVRAEGLREANNAAWGAAYSAAWFLIDDRGASRDVRRAVAAGSMIDNADADTFGIEIEFWDASSYRSIWVGKTDTYDPGSLQQSVSAFADVVVNELRANGML